MGLLKNPAKKIVFGCGPAGTGKTLLAVEQGVRGFMDGTYDKLIFTRPVVTVDEDLGYLPGTLEEKMAPYLRPIFDILCPLLSIKEVNRLLQEKTIEIAPLGMMRGRTFTRCWIVADEMQNSTVAQMKMLLTRLGAGSKMAVLGDLEQDDLHGGGGGGGGGGCGKEGEKKTVNGLEDFLSRMILLDSPSISSIHFQLEDVEREAVVKDVLQLYSVFV